MQAQRSVETWLRHRRRARCVGRLASVIAVVLAASSSAQAFKWSSCPAPPLPVYPSELGATNAPFIHPGHPLTIVLNDDELAATGGFNLETAGNDVTITFASIFGPPIALPPRAASATSSSALTIDFPDTQAEGFGTLAGPVEIDVTANGRERAHIAASDLVALPPPTDVTSIVLGGSSTATVLAALGADGDIWVPATFHGDPMSMPGCPGDFIMPVPIALGGATVDGAASLSPNPLLQIRGVDAFLGDMVIDGFNFYGMASQQRINLVHVNGTLGVSLCRLNDALNTVLRVRGNQSWAVPSISPFQVVAASSNPIALRLTSAQPNPADQGVPDSFGNLCVPGYGR